MTNTTVMKTTVDNKVIIYDNSCPMCSWYTGIFINNNMLAPNGRMGFEDLAQSKHLAQLDLHRAKHEIPLVDTHGGETLYGLDAMAHIIGGRFPLVKWLLGIRPVNAFFQQFYHFISYNRRVIAGTAKAKKGIDCTPDVNLTYRAAYIVFALLATIGIGIAFGNTLAADTTQSLMLIAFAWMAFAPAGMFMDGKRLDYLGNVATILLIGALTLLPGIMVHALGIAWIGLPIISLTISVGVMMWEYVRRVRNMVQV
jgi:predicted DCC family thiol-disulfide oxidoreductase YuxK